MLEQTPSETLALGIGTAGCKIAARMSKESTLIDRYAYVSCDQNDFASAPEGSKILIQSPVDQKLTPAMVRGLSIPSFGALKSAIEGARVVFVVAGLGGATGSGLAPLLASMAQEAGATTVGVAVMPFDYEKKLRFYAGVSLKRLRASSRGVIVIDNDTMLRSAPGDSTLTDVLESANGEAVKALSSLLSKSADSTVPVGLNKVLGTVCQDGYSLLGMSSSASSDKAEEALAGAVVSLSKIARAKEVSHAVVMLTGDKSVSATDVGTTVRRLSSLVDNQSVDVEYGVSYTGGSQLQVSLLASGFKSTKYDEYDPLGAVLGDRVLDEDMEYSLPGGLDMLPPCD